MLKRKKKISKINRLSKIEEGKIRTNPDDLMEKYASKHTNPINDMRNLFQIEKDNFIKNKALEDVPILFKDNSKYQNKRRI